jgi:rhodanese-related sulfurtransferase
MTNPNEAFAKLTAEVKTRIKETTVQDVSSGAAKGLLVDVRDPDEFAAGHIPGAAPASRGTLEGNIAKIAPDTSAPLILYCGGGTRSAFAADMLQQMGYTNVLSMQGGIREWKAQNLPLEK